MQVASFIKNFNKGFLRFKVWLIDMVAWFSILILKIAIYLVLSSVALVGSFIFLGYFMDTIFYESFSVVVIYAANLIIYLYELVDYGLFYFGVYILTLFSYLVYLYFVSIRYFSLLLSWFYRSGTILYWVVYYLVGILYYFFIFMCQLLSTVWFYVFFAFLGYICEDSCLG